MRPRTLSLIATFAVLGAAVVAPPALATPSKVKLEVNQNCVDPEWPCWTAEPSASRPSPDLKFSITEGGKVEFADHDPATETSVVWTGGPTTPSCPGVPTTTTVSTGWEGTCTFAQPGTYMFKSPNMFNGPRSAPYGDEDYTEYEVVVTGPLTPTATTEQTTAVTETEATLNGDVSPEGQTTSYYFEYGTTTAYGSQTTETPVSSAGRVSAALTGLSPSTTYYVQLVAVYGTSKTKVEGGNMTFKTASPPSAPTVSTLPATVVTETEATLKGTTDPDGEATEYFFEYGTETSYGHTTGEVTLPASENGQAVSITIKGLIPGTEYHFRLVAKNKLGLAQGNDLTFMTASPPSAKEPTKEPAAKESSPTPAPTSGSPTATTSSSPSSGQPQDQPAPGPLFGTIKLASHGGVVHGSLVVSSAGSAGRLQIELLTKGVAAPFGKLARSSLHAGKLTFALALNAKGKAVLRRHQRLTLTVKITLTPMHRAAVTVTRSVVMHA